jgi:hypothetical protein
MLHVIIMTLLALLATALPSAADIYKYRDANGKLVITNQPPPAGAQVETQRPSRHVPTPQEVRDAYKEFGLTPPEAEPTAPRPAPEPTLSYVDLNPLELQGGGVESSGVYWKRFVTGAVKNRSGMTTAANVTVRAACTLGGRPADTGTAYLGTIGPRGAVSFQIPIILDVQEYYVRGKGWFTPKIGRVSCETEATYDTL